MPNPTPTSPEPVRDELDADIVDAVARALFEEEWRPAKNNMPKFENDCPDYWRRGARAAILAYLKAAGIVEVPVIAEASDDLQGCEHCWKAFPIESMTLMGDCWFCSGCFTEWRAIFDACKHEWEPETNEFGDPGKYCNKCMGFVPDEAPSDSVPVIKGGGK